jgi:flagellar hook-associated protein 2
MTSGINSASSNIVNLLGAGSGVDLKSLAQELTDAEKAPRQALIDAGIKTNQARISGYSSVMYALGEFKKALADVQDRSGLASPSAQVTPASMMSVNAGPSASTGSRSVEVVSLLKPQRSMSEGFSSDTGSYSVTFTAGTGKVTSDLTLTSGSLTALAADINSRSLGFRASVENTGAATNPYRIVLTSDQAGAAGSFSLAGIAGMTFTTVTPAADAQVRIDGVDYWRPSNTITDVIPGVTMNLTGITSAPGLLQVNRDTASIKTRLEKVVSTFNDLQSALNVVSDAKSTVPDMGGTLVSESLVNQIRQTAISMITAESHAAATGSPVRSLRDLGLEMQKNGELQISQIKVDANGNRTSSPEGRLLIDYQLDQRFDDVVKMLTNNADHSADNLIDQALPGYKQGEVRGAAGDAVKKLIGLMSKDGPLLQRSTSAINQIKRLQERSAALESEMKAVLDRYTAQFAAMDAMVGRMNSLRESLKNQFDAMNSNNSK